MTSYDLSGKRVWVAGHRGMVGSAIVRRLADEPCTVLTAGRDAVDLRDQAATRRWAADHRPDCVIVAAARVGGIVANARQPADFLLNNLQIATNAIEASHAAGVEKLVFLGSSCVYPKFAEQPIAEEALLTGALEPTNEWYAVAKIAGMKLCEAFRRQHGDDFISVMPPNLYGPGDNYDLEKSHVVAALIRKAHEAKVAGRDVLPIWGTGAPRREFMHVDDAADAIVFLARHYSGDMHVNAGPGGDVTILELARIVCEVVGLDARIETDPSKPDGTPRKTMDSSRLYAMGWRPRFTLREGLADAYAAFLGQLERGEARLDVA